MADQMHIRSTNVLNDNRDAPLPHTQRLLSPHTKHKKTQKTQHKNILFGEREIAGIECI